MRMFGSETREATPKIVLRKPSLRFRFMRDSTNVFSVTAPNFQQLSNIEMEVSFRLSISYDGKSAKVII